MSRVRISAITTYCRTSRQSNLRHHIRSQSMSRSSAERTCVQSDSHTSAAHQEQCVAIRGFVSGSPRITIGAIVAIVDVATTGFSQTGGPDYEDVAYNLRS